MKYFIKSETQYCSDQLMRRHQKKIAGGINGGGEFIPKWIHEQENHMWQLLADRKRNIRFKNKRKKVK